MLNALEVGGHWGLSWYLWKGGNGRHARASGKQAGSWDKVRDDYREGRYFVYLQLLSLPIPVLRSLVRNTLLFDIQHKQDVKTFHKYHMLVVNQRGIYYNLPQRKGNQTGFLSASEAHLLNGAVKNYLGKDREANLNARSFDLYLAAPSNTITRPIEDRRWVPSAQAAANLNLWAESITRHASTRDGERDIPQQRVPLEIGWADKMDVRVGQHLDSSSTNYIFGFFNTWSRHVLEAFGPPAQGCIFRIWHHDSNLPPLSEVLATLLCCSHVTEGGFNPIGAGGFSTTMKGKEGYELARSEVFGKRAHVARAIEADLARLDKMVTTWHASDQDKEEEEAALLSGIRSRLLELQSDIEAFNRDIHQAAQERRKSQQERNEQIDANKQLLRIGIIASDFEELKEKETRAEVDARRLFDERVWRADHLTSEFPPVPTDAPHQLARQAFETWQTQQNNLLAGLPNVLAGGSKLKESDKDAEFGVKLRSWLKEKGEEMDREEKAARQQYQEQKLQEKSRRRARIEAINAEKEADKEATRRKLDALLLSTDHASSSDHPL